MSDAGDILSAITTDVETAVAGVTVTLLAVNFEDIKAAQLPYCRLLLVDYSVDPLDWSQEQRQWTILGTLAQDGGTRETMHTKLEAIRDQIFADNTLGGVVHRCWCAPIVPYSHPDEDRIYGEFTVVAEIIV